MSEDIRVGDSLNQRLIFFWKYFCCLVFHSLIPSFFEFTRKFFCTYNSGTKNNFPSHLMVLKLYGILYREKSFCKIFNFEKLDIIKLKYEFQ